VIVKSDQKGQPLTVHLPHRKPLKRLTEFGATPGTGLKAGVNEIARDPALQSHEMSGGNQTFSTLVCFRGSCAFLVAPQIYFKSDFSLLAVNDGDGLFQRSESRHIFLLLGAAKSYFVSSWWDVLQ
jgi:hypothetical protein